MKDISIPAASGQFKLHPTYDPSRTGGREEGGGLLWGRGGVQYRYT